MKKLRAFSFYIFLLALASNYNYSAAQQVEVDGQLKVTQMNSNDEQENLVIRNEDGTLGTRSVASLPPPPAEIDSTRNLSSDLELAKQLCECPKLPPFMIQKLLESGYTVGDLRGAGIDKKDITDAQRFSYFTDARDNQTYKTVVLGSQTWMAENLNIGIRVNEEDGQSENSIIEKYCYQDQVSNCDVYGGLYQWDELMQYSTSAGAQAICPDGWHIPSDDEWKTLEIYLGITQAQADNIGGRGTDEGSQLASNASLWSDGNLEQSSAFGRSGFDALPGGYSTNVGTFTAIRNHAQYYTSSDVFISSAYVRTLSFVSTTLSRSTVLKTGSNSVRCIQD